MFTVLIKTLLLRAGAFGAPYLTLGYDPYSPCIANDIQTHHVTVSAPLAIESVVSSHVGDRFADFVPDFDRAQQSIFRLRGYLGSPGEHGLAAVYPQLPVAYGRRGCWR